MGRDFENRKHSIMKTAGQKSKLYSRYGKQLYVTSQPRSLDLLAANRERTFPPYKLMERDYLAEAHEKYRRLERLDLSDTITRRRETTTAMAEA